MNAVDQFVLYNLSPKRLLISLLSHVLYLKTIYFIFQDLNLIVQSFCDVKANSLGLGTFQNKTAIQSLGGFEHCLLCIVIILVKGNILSFQLIILIPLQY